MESNNFVIMAIGLLFVLNVVPRGRKVYHQRMRLNFGMKGIMNVDDLIFRKKAIEAVKIPDDGCSNPSERHGIIFARVEARRAIQSIPPVPAVPMDKLCEWLARANGPVPCNDDCENCTVFDGTGNTVNCWKKIVSEWMANY